MTGGADDKAPVDEFDFIARLMKPLTGGAREALDLLDDAAVLPARPGFDLVVTSDTDSFLAQVVDHLGAGSVARPIGQVADAVDEPLSAEIYDGDYTCSKLAMGQADPTDEAQGQQLIAEAGKVNPVLGFAMAREPTSAGKAGDVRVALAFADHGQAGVNATTRAKLASGDAPGQGGSFTDRFRLGQVAAHGQVVTMDLRPRDGSPVLSDLSTGPLLFATC